MSVSFLRRSGASRYEFDDLVKYCVALANEGGGKFVLGVTDKQPRRVVGTKAFDSLERTRAGLFQRLHFKVGADEIELHNRGFFVARPHQP